MSIEISKENLEDKEKQPWWKKISEEEFFTSLDKTFSQMPGDMLSSEMFEDSSLQDTIKYLENKENEITDKTLINLVIKYFAHYVNLNLWELSLEKINTLFYMVDSFFKIRNTTKQCEKQYGKQVADEYYNQALGLIFPDEGKLGLAKFFIENEYGLVMLGDISSTVSIMRNIIEQKINPDDFNGKYLWLDLGSGTGILLVAQYLQAKRNGFTEIENIGIEINPTLQFLANNIIQKLELGKVVLGDTTNPDIYKDINNYITHISNETITHPWGDMWGKEDPFHENIRVIYTTLWDKITTATTFFPEAIILRYDKVILGEGEDLPLIANKENKFHYQQNYDWEKEIRKLNPLPINWNFFEYISPVAITLQEGTPTKFGNFERLENVGKRIRPLVKQYPRAKRWELKNDAAT